MKWIALKGALNTTWTELNLSEMNWPMDFSSFHFISVALSTPLGCIAERCYRSVVCILRAEVDGRNKNQCRFAADTCLPPSDTSVRQGVPLPPRKDDIWRVGTPGSKYRWKLRSNLQTYVGAAVVCLLCNSGVVRLAGGRKVQFSDRHPQISDTGDTVA